MWKSDDEKRREAAEKENKVCAACHGTGTFGVRGGFTSPCSQCNGTGQR